MMILSVKNLTKSKVDKKALKSLPTPTKRGKQIEIDLVIIGEKRMRSLNRDWRGKDKATDVLSYEGEERNLKFKFISPLENVIYLGQIFICYPIMARQSKQFGYSHKEEMSRLLVHGILHLAGYDHEKSAKEDKKMMDLQEKILNKINK
jgi:probable rRNA maturation factor